MSENINNREFRKNVVKQMITQLHEGKSVDEVKKEFEHVFSGISASEISEAEGALIAEGLPVEEVQRLCDVHAAVFKGTIEEIHQPSDKTKIPGHPANILIKENEVIKAIIETQIKPNMDSDSETLKQILNTGFEKLSKIDLHYSKKENVMFPYMEKYGITAPPKVMWGVDDDIRKLLKEVKNNSSNLKTEEWKQKAETLFSQIEEMIFKEENILLPMVLETLTDDEWKTIANEYKEIGFMMEQIPQWNPTNQYTNELKEEMIKESSVKGYISMPSGALNLEEMTWMLNTLPFDITFVDKHGIVKYFSQGAERIFPRTTAVIGREVSNCHPPASVHIVEKIVEDLTNGVKDHEDFWINMRGKFILIRYYAVRNSKGEFLGVLEVSQDIKPIQEITGEKRLVEDK